MMAGRLWRVWGEFWFRPASPLGLVAARTILAAQALWIVLSRPDLPDIVGWPPEFWQLVNPFARLRYGLLGLPVTGEWFLYAALHGALVATLLGVSPRIACVLSAALLYHFAPLEDLILSVHTAYFRGLTLPVLGLFILAFAAVPRLGRRACGEYRWPLALIQVLFSMNYLWALQSKLVVSGLAWISGANIRGMILGNVTWEAWAPLGTWVASQPWLCQAIAIGTVVLELTFPLVLFSRTAATILVPVALGGHVAIILGMGVFFLSMPSLLLYLDWDRLDRWAPRQSLERPVKRT